MSADPARLVVPPAHGVIAREVPPRRGFTLLELMVALAVLAIVAMAVFGQGGDSVRDLHAMEQRTLARWVAENEVARMRLEHRGSTEPIRLGTVRQRLRQGDRSWQVVRETQSTSHPSLRRVEVTVYAMEEGREVGPMDTLVAFMGRY